MPNKIQLRRGNKANLPILDSGEPGFVLDTEELYIGKGTKNVKILTEHDLSAGSGLSYIDGVINNIDMGSTAVSQHLSNYDHDSFGGISWETTHW